MRVSVNLATRPFVELRPFFLRLRLMMAGLAVLGVLFAVSAHVLAARAARQQVELDRLRDQTIATQQARLHTEQRMRQPGNAAVLDRAHFLNTLFLRKSFSWTAVMMDLENVLPVGVQVTSIEPAVTAGGEVIIRLRVAGQRAAAIQLVRNLERWQRFLQPRLGSESAQSREQTGGAGRPANGLPPAPAGPAGVEFEILATYNPLPEGQPYAVRHERTSATGGRVAVEEPPAAMAVPQGAAEGNLVGMNLARARARARAAANVRNGYPAGGVVLPPYAGASGPRPMPPVAAQQGGGAR